MESIPVPIRKDVFERLQGLATPLVDDVNSVLLRLIDSWQRTRGEVPQQQASVVAPSVAHQITPQTPTPTMWRSSRGEQLPIGLELSGRYRRQTFKAKVTAVGIEFNGKTYDNPSTAAMAAKKLGGASDEAAPENGWTWWFMQSDVPNKWVAIDGLRRQS